MSYPFHASSAASSSKKSKKDPNDVSSAASSLKKDPNNLLKNLQVPPDKLVSPSMLRPPSPSISSDDSDVSLRPQVDFRTKTYTLIRVDDLVSAYFPISYDGFVRKEEINGIVKKKIGKSKFEVSFGRQVDAHLVKHGNSLKFIEHDWFESIDRSSNEMIDKYFPVYNFDDGTDQEKEDSDSSMDEHGIMDMMTSDEINQYCAMYLSIPDVSPEDDVPIHCVVRKKDFTVNTIWEHLDTDDKKEEWQDKIMRAAHKRIADESYQNKLRYLEREKREKESSEFNIVTQSQCSLTQPSTQSSTQAESPHIPYKISTSSTANAHRSTTTSSSVDKKEDKKQQKKKNQQKYKYYYKMKTAKGATGGENKNFRVR